MTKILAQQYASALAERSEDWVTILTQGAAVVNHPRFQKLLKNPFTPRDLLVEVLLSCLPANPAGSFFWRLLATRQRLSLTAAILRELIAIRNAQQGLITVHISTARTITAARKKKIENYAARLFSTQSRCIFHYSIQPELTAGFTLRYHNTLVDYSTRGQLLRMQQRLLGNHHD